MAYFAEVDRNNVVLRVLYIDDVHEHRGEEFLSYDLSLGGSWKQTSYNTRGGVHILGGTPFRKNYAGIGFIYNKELDAFIPPKPYASWVLDQETCLWNAPLPIPNDEKTYEWDEGSSSWVEYNV